MKIISLQSNPRTPGSKKEAEALRKEGYLPGVLYGQGETVHFALPLQQAEAIIYTPEVYFIQLKVGEKTYRAIQKELQVHPVSDTPLHIDMLEIVEDKPVTMRIPVTHTGKSPGILAGGDLIPCMRYARVKALPRNMPQCLVADISTLELNQKLRVREVAAEGFEILELPGAPIFKIGMSRALRSQAAAGGK